MYLAGTCTGLTGFGGAIVAQVVWRLSESIFELTLGSDVADSSRRILAIASFITISQAFVMGVPSLRSPHVLWLIVVLFFPGINAITWLGTFCAVALQQDFLVKFLGTSLIVIAVWQLFLVKYLKRSVDDEKVVKLAWENELAFQKKENGEAVEMTKIDSSRHQNPAVDGLVYSPVDDVRDAEAVSGWAHDTLEDNGEQVQGYLQGSASPRTDSSMWSPIASSEPEMGSNTSTIDAPVALHTIDIDDMDHTVPSGLGGMESVGDGPSALDGDDIVQEVAPETDTSNAMTIDQVGRSPAEMWNFVKHNKLSSFAAFFTGAASGFLGGSFGIGGPPVIVYVTFMQFTGDSIRSTYSISLLLNMLCFIPARFVYEVFLLSEIPLYILATVVLNLGIFTGTKLQPYCDAGIILLMLQFIVLLSSVPMTKPSTSSAFGIVIIIVYIFVLAFIAFLIIWRLKRDERLKNEVAIQALEKKRKAQAQVAEY